MLAIRLPCSEVKQAMVAVNLACFFVLFFLILVGCEVQQIADDCLPTICSASGPQIRFPFWLDKGGHSSRCGYGGFGVTCKGNDTRLVLSSNMTEVSMKDIDYKNGSLRVNPIDNCMDGLIFNLNLSATPFQYNEISTFFSTFFNCSIQLKNYSAFSYCSPISCMSGSGHWMCKIDSDSRQVGDVPVSCTAMKNLVYPFWSFLGPETLDLKWDIIPACKDCEQGGGMCILRNRTTGYVECVYPPSGEYRRKLLLIGVGVMLFVILLAGTVGFIAYRKFLKRRLLAEDQRKVEQFLENYKALRPTRYSYSEIQRMTNKFKYKLGEGGYGTVFKGKMPNGVFVAVKLLQHIGGDGDEFINEVNTLGRIHHVNVVRLLGFCAEKFKRALIYEFMPNESLEKFILSEKNNGSLVGWKKLEEIAIGIADGLDYLHTGCDHRILHFDIKPQNVLLDEKLNPKISDFGLAKLCAKEQSIVSVTAARGTVGYMAPEIFSRNFGNVSYKSDIYSFGILLLEIIRDSEDVDTKVKIESTGQFYFPEWAYNHLDQGGDLGLDIAENEDYDIAKKLAIVALWCIQWHPVDRPSMKSIIQMLAGSVNVLSLPPNPFNSKTGYDNKKVKPMEIALPVIVE